MAAFPVSINYWFYSEDLGRSLLAVKLTKSDCDVVATSFSWGFNTFRRTFLSMPILSQNFWMIFSNLTISLTLPRLMPRRFILLYNSRWWELSPIPDDCCILASGVVAKREFECPPPWLIFIASADFGWMFLSIFWTVYFASLISIGVKLSCKLFIVRTIGLNLQLSIPLTGLTIHK